MNRKRWTKPAAAPGSMPLPRITGPIPVTTTSYPFDRSTVDLAAYGI